ncbi:MAG: hypothetical protein FWC06_07350 [Treponema sp.]|nr:hypothetical protein [Treponema sp.]
MSRRISLVVFISLLFSVTVFAQYESLDMKIPVFKSVTYYAASIPGEDLYAIPHSISNNQYYMESLRLNGLALETFDYGDYEASAGFAREAYIYAVRSDEYVAIQLVNESERLLNWAHYNNIGELFSNAYNESWAYYEASLYALIHNRWNDSIMFSINSIEILAELELPEGVEPIPIEGIIRQQDINQPTNLTASASTGQAAVSQAQTTGAQTANQTTGTAIDQTTGQTTGTAAYQTAATGSSQIGVTAAARPAPLPSQYTVRTWAVERDSLWTIAGYPWVFNDPYRWPELYEANRSRMPQPDNPDLIRPGFIINIPSNRGELRQGMWDPNVDYGF